METRQPKLRFPGFEEDWGLKKIKDVIKSIDSGWSPQCEDFPSSLNDWGVLKTTSVVWEGFNENENKKLPTKLKPKENIEVFANDILITRAGPTNRVGVTVHVDKVRSKLMLSDKLIRLRTSKDFSSKFIAILLSLENIKIQIVSKSSGLAISQTNISQNILLNVNLNLPSLPEQTRIANFLSSVDEKLNLLKEKKALLEDYKKGIMQKIFNQEIRFKDDNGEDFEEWEEKQIKDIFKVTRGTVLSMLLVKDNIEDDFTHPVYSSQTKQKGLAGFYNNYLFENAITWTTDGAGAGDVKYREGKFYCTNVCGVLLNEDGYCNLFIAEMINSISRKYVSYVGNPKLMNNVMAEIRIYIPSSIKEQTKIANFLSAIDAKIDLVSNQIAETQEYKKGLLQQMFV